MSDKKCFSAVKARPGAAVIIIAALLQVLLLTGCGEYAKASESEIRVVIQLDLGEDIGLLIYDWDVNGQSGTGGMSNADGSMIRHDDILDWTVDRQQLEDPAEEVDVTLKFTVVTEYFDPNYDNIYPEEYMIPLDALSFSSGFGETYYATITGDRASGYRIVLDER